MSEMVSAFGPSLQRVDGRSKVTGSARYAAEYTFANLAHARLVTSRIARGHVTSIDTSLAEDAGAVLVLTHKNNDMLVPIESAYPAGQAQTTFLPMQSNEIRYSGQPIALVVADRIEIAEYAASLVKVEYASTLHETDLSSQLKRARQAVGAQDITRGDFEKVFADAAVRIDAVYSTATEHHNAMERFSTTAAWEGSQLIIHEPSQWVIGLRAYLADRFGLEPDQIRVISPFVGGGFGSKALPMPHTALAAIAARRIGRPVKLIVSRDQMFTVGGYRPASISHVRLGASSDGQLLAYSHDYFTQSSRSDLAGMPGIEAPNVLYRIPAVQARDRFVDLDLNHPTPMRAPQEVPSIFAFESAVDEVAHELGVDPLAFRLKNDAGARDPVTGLPFSSRSLAQCFTRGAELFGWAKRSLAPRSMREGEWLVGLGCGASIYPVFIGPASARIRLTSDGRAFVHTAGQDLGTGLYTVVAGVAAQFIGVPIDRVRVEMGNSDLPFGSMAAGSRSTASLVPAVRAASIRTRDRLIAEAIKDQHPLAGRDPARLSIVGNAVVSTVPGDTASELVSEILKRIPGGFIEETADFTPEGLPVAMLSNAYSGGEGALGPVVEKKWAMYSFGAQFVEVRVHRLTAQLRVSRAVGVFGAGRIANPTTAHSQLMGGMIWGISSGLFEATKIDNRYGRYVNTNLAEYPLPVCADIGSIEVEMVEEEDLAKEINPSGMKGVGELAVVGTGAAIANAVFHATGRRVRHLPITIEDVIDAL
ncbi:xanthine dehydrogenase family protein molybdopterin-binding subunit (plasmid) [Agrobacterium sp. 33MFTa1.1]|nr:xanthine dehydrogenase family protein molybdopterin-binding subunit [Agrobacterium sp. 33MFTa1.1]